MTLHRPNLMPKPSRYEMADRRGVVCAAVFVWAFGRQTGTEQPVGIQLGTTVCHRYRKEAIT
jgi:hypothetical protein